jgi:hypothetical protein
MSETDLDAGVRWGRELAEQLQETNFGIICATRQSIESAWLLFEAGALSKSTASSRVCPYLIGLKARLLTGPLSQFQTREATAEGTLSLLQSVNNSMGDDALRQDQLERNFARFWPDLEAVLRQVRARSILLPGQKRDFIKLLLSAFGIKDLDMLFAYNDLPSELVNWNQALLYVCSDAIDAVEQENRWVEFLEAIEKERPDREDVVEFVKVIRRQVEEAG